jgi:hypothetical protein
MAMADAHAATRPVSRPLLAIAGLFGVLFAAALLLWVHYGTAVFFDMIAAGIAACF